MPLDAGGLDPIGPMISYFESHFWTGIEIAIAAVLLIIGAIFFLRARHAISLPTLLLGLVIIGAAAYFGFGSLWGGGQP